MLRRLLTGLLLRRFAVPRDAVRWAFRKHADRTAILTSEGRRITFAELGTDVYALAAGMLARGLVPGDRVAFTLPNVPEFVALRLACHEAGLVSVPLIWDLPAAARAEALAATEAKLYVFDPELDPAPAVPGARLVPASDLGRLAKPDAGPCAARIDPRSAATINFTSGTTGSPKGVVSTHAAYAASLRMTVTASRLSPVGDEKFLHAIPLATAGWGAMLPCLLGGAASLLIRKWEPDVALDFAAREHATRTLLTPSQIIDWLDEPGLGVADLSALRGIIYGTAPLAGPKAAEAILRLGPKLHQGYGLAEALPPLVTLTPDEHDPRKSPFRAGRPARGVEVRVVDDASGRPMPPPQRGAVEVKSPTQTPGYWRRADLTAAAMRDGFFRTGDIGFWDESGYLNVIGRASEALPGFPLHPREVEEAACEHLALKECALVESGGKPVLAYSVRRGRELEEGELIAFLVQRLPAGSRPARCIRYFGDLPRSAAGKIVRGQIRLSRPPVQRFGRL